MKVNRDHMESIKVGTRLLSGQQKIAGVGCVAHES